MPNAGFPGLPVVSRETTDSLEHYLDLLRQWQKTHNLVAPSTIPDLWSRHVLDSLRLWPTVESYWKRGVLVDLGSGAGFPGLVLAIMVRQARLAQPNRVHLIESNGKKASFLRHVARALNLDVTVHAARIEDVTPQLSQNTVDVVTARALAPLDQLLALAEPLLIAGATAIFPKGVQFEVEVEKARRYWNFDLDLCGQMSGKSDGDQKSGSFADVGPVLTLSRVTRKDPVAL